MIAFSLLMLLPGMFTVIAINRKTHNAWTPASVMFYIWSVLLILATWLGASWGYYPMGISGIFIVSLFLEIILLVFFAGSNKDTTINHQVEKCNIYGLCVFLILLYLFSEIMYFSKLNEYIPIKTLPFRVWNWKMLILSGTFNEKSILFIGRNLTFFGTILSYTFINEKTKKRKFFLGTVLLIYVLMAFVNPRRDVMITKLVYLLVPFLFRYRNETRKLMKLVFPVIAIFTVVFFYINESLSFGDSDIKRTIASYSFGVFNSLQKAIDVGYDSNSNLIMGNTFYFIYMILKYISPQLAPPGIVLEVLGEDTSNVYSALIAPVIDSDGSIVALVFITFIYACWIGICLVFAYNWYSKKQTIASLYFCSTIYSCVIRSFYNPTFSYSDIVFGMFYSLVLFLVTQTKREKRNLVKKI